MLWIWFVYWLHWVLDVAFAAACLSIIFRPVLIARLYVLAFLGQQLILNGCMMTWLEGQAEKAHGWPVPHNQFIMSYMLNGPLVWAYKALFLIVVVWQIIMIAKEIPWKIQISHGPSTLGSK